MPFPVSINGNTYQSGDFSPYGYVTAFPAIISDIAAVGAAFGGATPYALAMLALSSSSAVREYFNRGTSALTDAATVNTNCSGQNLFTLTIGGNRTLANPTNKQSGATYIWVITQDGTGGRTLAYGSDFTWVGGTVPILSTAAGAVDIICAVYDGSKLRAVMNKGFA